MVNSDAKKNSLFVVTILEDILNFLLGVLYFVYNVKACSVGWFHLCKNFFVRRDDVKYKKYPASFKIYRLVILKAHVPKHEMENFIV